MADATDRTPACNLCRHWAPNIRDERSPEGVCRKLVENPTYYGSLVTEASDNCEHWALLGTYEDATGEGKEDRRAALRNRINLPGRLRTAGSVQLTRLVDISEFGAGISMRNPPTIGSPAVLEWGSYEVFGTIAWSNDASCGLRFDVPISREVVFEAMREGALKNDRRVDTSRIALGRKRASLFKGPSHT